MGTTPQELAAEVWRLAEPAAAAAGLDLVDVEARGTGGRRRIRVIVDRDGGVGIEACRALSRTLSAGLDAADPIEDRYDLEVTSPGVDRPLVGARAFARVAGRAVQLRTHDGAERTGTVEAVEDDAVVLEVDGEREVIALRDIDHATQALPW